MFGIYLKTDKDLNNPDNVILIYYGISVNAAQEYNTDQIIFIIFEIK
jgi:hypothetical protein